MSRQSKRPFQDGDDREENYVESGPSSHYLRIQNNPPKYSELTPSDRTSSERTPSKRTPSEPPPKRPRRSQGTGKEKVEFGAFVEKMMISDDEAPPELKALAKELHILAAGVHTIPDWQIDAFASSSDEEHQLIATDLGFMFVEDAVRAALGPCPSVESVEKIMNATRTAERADFEEAAWNTKLHDPTLDLAFENKRFRSKFHFIQCTTARIEPDDLLPRNDGGEPMQSRMVDFAGVLRPNARILAAWQKLNAADPKCQTSWNQSFFQQLKKQPIVVSVETKISGSEKKKAIQQLATWVTAQFRKLEQLVPSEQARAELPFLPLILIQGPDWHFLAATRKDERTYLWEGVHLGSTMAPRQMYPLIACLQRVGIWALDVYEPWFDRNVVDVLLRD
ncbi:hypothetical protein yc1106_07564 [Curvularia clavata]|uniref:PD-(D/E)XK nuclease-like domain-containing protein n=1 Tax=Curvularia clavata TaxID=95742 RepID=A0A9Q9DVT9_CURCL|nr:hypothetical protein yc1106_07564 [Curvularia clavata]